MLLVHEKNCTVFIINCRYLRLVPVPTRHSTILLVYSYLPVPVLSVPVLNVPTYVCEYVKQIAELLTKNKGMEFYVVLGYPLLFAQLYEHFSLISFIDFLSRFFWRSCHLRGQKNLGPLEKSQFCAGTI